MPLHEESGFASSEMGGPLHREVRWKWTSGKVYKWLFHFLKD